MSDKIDSVKGLRRGMIIRCLDNSAKGGMLPTHLTKGRSYVVKDITPNDNEKCKILIWVDNDKGYLEMYSPDRFDDLREIRSRVIDDILS